MSTMYRYTLPVEQTKWKFDGQSETCFTWEYDDSRAALLQLYDKGKKQQWDSAERIDWSLDLDPENRRLNMPPPEALSSRSARRRFPCRAFDDAPDRRATCADVGDALRQERVGTVENQGARPDLP